jgi:hypothetical protein
MREEAKWQRARRGREGKERRFAFEKGRARVFPATTTTNPQQT